MSSFCRVWAAIALAIAIASSRPSSGDRQRRCRPGRAPAPSVDVRQLRSVGSCAGIVADDLHAARRPGRAAQTTSAITMTASRKSGSSGRRAGRSSHRSSTSTSAMVPSADGQRSSSQSTGAALDHRQPEARRGSGRAPSPSGRQAEQVLQLVEDEQHRRPEREADDDGVRDVARQVAEPQQRDAGLHARRRGARAGSAAGTLLAVGDERPGR